MADDRADELEELRDVARRVLEKESSPRAVRSVTDDALGHDPALWRTMAELGWTGLGVPEALGGVGGGFEAQAVVLGELGRAVTPGPYLSTVVLGAGALMACDWSDGVAELLSSVAAGDLTLAVVLPATGGGALPVAHGRVGGWVLRGTVPFALDAAVADRLLVVAQDADEVGVAVLAVVDPAAPGVEPAPLPTIDRTRRLARVQLDDVAIGANDVLGSFDEEPFVSWLTDRAAAALAADSVGGAQRVLEMSVDYAKVRVQFGRPIGTFQAIKHKCADMLLLVEASRVAADDAAARAPSGPGGDWRPAAIAKSYACDAYAKVTADALQLHGGIGFTWDHDLHLYFKRAKLNQALFGDPAWYRARLATALLAGGG